VKHCVEEQRYIKHKILTKICFVKFLNIPVVLLQTNYVNDYDRILRKRCRVM
jgi:hypothetical protein